MNMHGDTKTRMSLAAIFASLGRLLRVPGRRTRPARRRASFVAVLAGASLLLAAVPAQAAKPAQGNFGFNSFDVTFTNADGTTATQAGSHPFAITTTFAANLDSEDTPEGWLRDLIVAQVPGLAADTTAYTRCSNAEFLAIEEGISACQAKTAVGIVAVSANSTTDWRTSPIYHLTPPPGVLMRLGFTILSNPVVIDVGLESEPPYLPQAASRNTTQVVEVIASKIQLWGDPSDPSHDYRRGPCGVSEEVLPGGELDEFSFKDGPTACPVEAESKPFLTLPTTCSEALLSSYEAISWEGDRDIGGRLSHDLGGNDQPFTGCGALPSFHPSITAEPTTVAATSPTGLDFSLDVEDLGLTDVNGRSQSGIEKVVATLPEGMTVNPSQAEGLEACTESDLRRETATAAPGEGCPQESKIGSVEVESPLVAQTLHGSLFVAEPYHNLADNSLIALYLVFKNKNLGIVVKQPLKVTPDSKGRLTTTADDIPQLPFSHFRLHFREGGRAPLISPPGCGTFEVKAMLYPWSGGPAAESSSDFQIISGPNNSPCPSGAAPFHPGFEAGALNNAAGRYSEFDMRITRGDGEQDLTKFSSVLPPGVVASLVGTSWCPESGIARAMSRTGDNGGTDERSDPSCPADSKIGTTLAGAGVGGQLTYIGGSLYLAGPYNGAPLSVVAITPAVAGPFDAGTVVVREALRLNSVTGVAEVDGAASDPIPHILKGIPLNVRDLRVAVDKPDFTLNATSCAELQTKATLWGGGTVLAPTPDSPVDLAARYQAADCAALGFKPRVAIRLYGGTRRGAHPALRAIVRPRPGEANFSRAAVTLPRSAFLDQGHIRTICTRVQFAAGAGHGSQCPKGAVYGSAKAWSPLLDGPATGPVYLRSSNNNLPDLVVALKGPDSAPVEVELASRIDSVKGGIRSIFTGIPDVPVSRFVLAMQGGKKGLIVNSRNLCRKPGKNRAKANLVGQNGRRLSIKPVVRAVKCAKKRKKAKRSSHRRARVASASTVR